MNPARPARLVFPALRWEDRDLDGVWPEVRDALDRGVGGFVAFGGSTSDMLALTRRAKEHARRPLLFAADLERGAGQQFNGATQLPPPAALAELGDAAIAEAAGITAIEAGAAGIGWVFAPVADLDVEPQNPIVGTRGFGAEPHNVARQVRVWVESAQAEGIHACAKHFPGHGRSTTDSHAALPVIEASRATLEDDLLPFRAAIDAGVRSIMLAHVAYPALDPEGGGRPASLSPSVIGLLREELGFAGLLVTDALIMGAIAASGRVETEAAVESIRAGCDVLLYPTSVEDTVDALAAALDSGDLEDRRVAQAVERVEGAASEIVAHAAAQLDEAADQHPGQALRLAVASLEPLRGMRPSLRAGESVRLHVIDDDSPAQAAAGSAPGTRRFDRSALANSLRKHGAPLLDSLSFEEDACDLIAVFSDVRAWKGRVGLAPESVRAVNAVLARAPDATVILFAHPRTASELPAARHILGAWCGDSVMQEAVAQQLVPNPPS